jgi:hypothetical protein
MGSYYRKTNKDNVSDGFKHANPSSFGIKQIVLNELRENSFDGVKFQDPWEHIAYFKEASMRNT